MAERFEEHEEHEGYDALRPQRRSLRGMIGWVLRHMAGAGLWETYAELGDRRGAGGGVRDEMDTTRDRPGSGCRPHWLGRVRARHPPCGGLALRRRGGAVLLLDRVRLVAWWHAFHSPAPMPSSVSTCEDSNIPHVDTDTDAVRQAEDAARRAVDRSRRNTRDADSARVHQPLTETDRGDG